MKRKIILALVIIFVAIADLLFALRNKFLEVNPFVLTFGWGFLIFFKIFLVILVVYFIKNNRYRNETQLFYFSSSITLMILLWGFGALLGLYAGAEYNKEEVQVIQKYEEKVTQETGIAPTQIQIEEYTAEIRQQVKTEVKKRAIPEYIKISWRYGIYPYIFSIVSFSVFSALYPMAIFKKRKWE